MSTRSANVSPRAAKPLDSDRLFELEDRVKSEANWLIYLSILTIVAGFAVRPVIVMEGMFFLALSIFLKVKQSRSAAILLSVAAAASCLMGIVVGIAGGRMGDTYIAFAQPVLALLVSVVAGVNAFRLQRLLETPIAANRDQDSGT